MAQRRVPREENAFNVWYQNFNNNLTVDIATALEITTAQRSRVTNDSTAWNCLILRNEVVRSYKEEESGVKKRAYADKSGGAAMTLPTLTLPDKPDVTFNPGIRDWINTLVQRAVKTDGCTPEIEALLDIALKDEDSILPEERRGIIKKATALNGGSVMLKSSLQNLKSYGVYSQRGASDEFVHIGDSTEIEYTDARPNLVANQPETRQYKTICLEGNKPVGDFSQIETIVTKP
jgi:hypothetical protein